MVTAWIIKKKDSRGKIIYSVYFYGDGMHEQDLEIFHSGNPRFELVSIEQVNPRVAFNMKKKYWIEEEKP